MKASLTEFEALAYIPHVPETSGITPNQVSSILGQSETNQQIFDAFVRSVLDDCEVEYIEQPIEGLLEQIENDEASVNAAFNLIVAAHVAFHLAAHFTPIEDPTWTNSLKVLKSRIASGLLKCRKILNANCFNSEQVEEGSGSSGSSFWNYVVPVEYGLDPWEEFKGSRLLTPTKFKADPFFRDIDLWFPIDHPCERLAFEYDLIERSDITTLTTWHYFAMSKRLNALIENLEPLEFNEWATAIDVCSLLMSRAEPLKEENQDSITEQSWSFNSSEIKVSPTSAEHWAWQFGRVTALWSMQDKDEERTRYFDALMDPWPNGLSALSLLCIPRESYARMLESCWDGVIVSRWPRGQGSHEDASQQLPSSHFFWLMRLGFLDGVKRIEGRKNDVATHSPESKESDVLLLGSSKELSKAWLEVQEAADRERENQIENKIAERLGEIWELIPPDSRQQLIEAEFNLKSHKAAQASLNYANAVEAVLAEWLSDPKGRGDWPKGISQWEDCVRKMTREKGRRHRLDSIFRQRFDPRHAAKLAEALDVFREGRLPGAHGKPLPPFALKAKETALGNEHTASVFELLLKFAKRWR